MHLSEAIREGAKLRPQNVRGGFFLQGKSCAIGAASEAIGNVLYGADRSCPASHNEAPSVIWPILKTWMKCPCNGVRCEGSLDGIIYTLNDNHNWSREAISEFVETVERKLGLWDSPIVEEATKVSVEYAEKGLKNP